MPLPIETPGPKASSLIKRFQQTIDSADQSAPPPLPKQRLSQGDDSARNRRSWAVASGGAPLPQQAVVWQPSKNKPDPSLSSPAEPSTPQLHGSPAPLVPETLPIQNHGSHPSPASSPNPNSTPLVVSPPPQDPIQLEPKALSPVPTPPLTAAEIQKSGSSSGTSKSSSSAAGTERKPKALVSADIALPTRTRKTTNITAPTAASLAKIRSSDSSTHSAAGAPRNVSMPLVSASSKLPKASPETSLVKKTSTGARALAARAARASTSPSGGRLAKTALATPPLAPASPKPRPRSGSLVSSTSTRPLQRKLSAAHPTPKTKTVTPPPFGAGPGLRAQSKSPGPAKTARRMLSPAPQLSARSPKAPAATAGLSGGLKTDNKRSVQRARVASVATPVITAKKPAAGPAGPAKTAVPAKPGSLGKPGAKTKSGIPMATGSPGRKVSKATLPSSSTGVQGEKDQPVEAGGNANERDTAAANAEVDQEFEGAGGMEIVVTDEEASVKGSLVGLASKEDDDRLRVENDAATTNTDGEEEEEEEEEGPVALSAQEISEMLTLIEQDQEREIARRSVPSSVSGPEAGASLGGFREGGDADAEAREMERPVPLVIVEHTGSEEPESAQLALATETLARPTISEPDACAPSHDPAKVADELVPAYHEPELVRALAVSEDTIEPDPATAPAVVVKNDTRVAEPASPAAEPPVLVVDDNEITDELESAADTGDVEEDKLAPTPADALEDVVAGQVVSASAIVANEDELAPIRHGPESGAIQVAIESSVAESEIAAGDPTTLETAAPPVVVEDTSITVGNPHGLGSAPTQVVLDSASVTESGLVGDSTLETAPRGAVTLAEDSTMTDSDKALTPEIIPGGAPGQSRPPSIGKQAKRRSGIAAW